MFTNQFYYDSDSFQWLWWIQDGAPAHRLREVNDLLLWYFQNRVISLNNGVEWPPHFPT